MSDARRLAGPQRVRLPPAPPGPGAPHKRGGGQTASARAESEPLPFTVEQDGAAWTARANGIDRAFLKKLAAGKVAVEAKLDLHGQSRKEAQRALGRGLHSGDEGPALRDTVRDFLVRGAFATRVLAAAAAPPSLGGAGATLVWLRRPG